MRKFLLKCSLLMFIVAGLLSLSSAVYVRSNGYKNLNIQDWTDKYEAMPESVDVAVFGSSHGYRSFVGAPEGCSFFNYSLSSQTPQYDLMQMREFQDHFSPGTLVLLTLSYTSPYHTDSEDEFIQKNPRYYRILSPKNIIGVDPYRYALQKCFPIFTESFVQVVGHFLREPQLLVIDRNKQFNTENLQREQERILRAHWGSIESCFPETSPVMLDAYHQMLDMCRDNGWIAILFTPPYLKEYNDCFPETFFPAFFEVAESLCQEYGVPYLNYSHDPAFTDRYDLFSDIDHLNLAGATAFDEQFFSDIHDQGIW